MKKKLGIELYGPCTEESELIPQINDTVATIEENGQVRFHSITGANMLPEGLVLYGAGGERLFREQCYLLYAPDSIPTE